MDVVKQLENIFRGFGSTETNKPIIKKAIKELKKLRKETAADNHLLPKRTAYLNVNVGFLEKWLKLPPDHYVESVWQDGQDKFMRHVKIVIVGPMCPQTLFGERIPEINLLMHTDKEFSTIEEVK